MNREVQNFVDSKVAEWQSNDVTKRSIDILLSLFGLIFLLPAMALIALILLLQDGPPIFFSQRRIGRGGREFSCLKFRTMKQDAEQRLADFLRNCEASRQEWETTQKLKNDPRITRFGSFLRRSSLDELPQLINVLRGEMSLVGPRPIVRAEIPRYADAYIYYIAVRPGLTGLWQINGRNDTSYSERVRLDLQYVQTGTLRTDLIILIKTVAVVLLGRGSY